MRTIDIGHRRGWLAPAAAASLRRVDRRLGRPLDVNSAGRTRDEQMQAFLAFKAGTGARALHPDSELAFHVRGRAVDTDDRLPWIREHGWIADIPGEPWHHEYRQRLDRFREAGDDLALDDGEEEVEMRTFITESAQAVKFELVSGRKRSIGQAEWQALRALQAQGMPMFVAILPAATIRAIPGQ